MSNSDSKDDNSNPNLNGLYAQRLPTDLVIRVAQAQAQQRTKFKTPIDPYSPVAKARFEDAFRADPIVRIAVIRKAEFMLGKHFNTVLDVADNYDTLRQLAYRHAITDYNRKMNEYSTSIRKQRMDAIHYPSTPNLVNLIRNNSKTNTNLSTASRTETRDIKKSLGASYGTNLSAAFNSDGGGQSLLSKGVPGIQVTKHNTPAAALKQNQQQMGNGITVPNIYDPLIQANLDNAILPQDEPEMLDITNLPLEELKKLALKSIMSDQEYISLKNQIDLRNKKVDFHAKSISLVIQSFVGGRSVGLIEKDKDKLPTDLKILNWQRLGNVILNEDTWSLEGVQYLDWEAQDNPIEADEMLYFPAYDFNISLNSQYFGLSSVEPVAHISETNRIVDEMDIKEIARNLWAGVGVIKLANRDPAVHDRLLSNINPGTWMSTDLDTQVEIHQMGHDLDKLLTAHEENDRRILRGLEVPSALVGFEQIANRATMEQILLAWKESVLEYWRSWYRNIVERQWLDTMTLIILQETDIDQLEAKVKCEFEDITFESSKDKAIAFLPIWQAGAIPIEKFLKLMDMDDVIEDAKLMQEQQQKQRLAYYQQQQMQMSQQMNNNGGGNTTNSANSQPPQKQQPKPQQQQQNIQQAKTENITTVEEEDMIVDEALSNDEKLEQINTKIANAKLELITNLNKKISELS